MHQGTVAVVDPSTAPGGFDVDQLRSLVEARKGLLGPFLRRLIEVPLGLDRPAWVDDPHFDLNRQIRPVGVPAPGGPRELGALVGDLLAYMLEPGRPLWEVWFIEGPRRWARGSVHEDASLPGGRSAGRPPLRGALRSRTWRPFRSARYARASGRANSRRMGDGFTGATSSGEHPAPRRPHFWLSRRRASTGAQSKDCVGASTCWSETRSVRYERPPASVRPLSNPAVVAR